MDPMGERWDLFEKKSAPARSRRWNEREKEKKTWQAGKSSNVENRKYTLED